MNELDKDRAAYQSGLEARSEGDAIEENPFDFERENSEWQSWLRGYDEAKRRGY